MDGSLDILIVGGGIAGLSTARQLAARGRRVVLLEREDQPGAYASSHNAAIARQLTGRAEHTLLAVEGRRALGEAGLVRETGGFLQAAAPGSLTGLEAEGRAFGVPAELRPGAGFPGTAAAEHLWVPTDGVIDIHGELDLCLREARAAGAELRFGCALESLEPDAEGFRARTSAGELRVRHLVNAAGAWAAPLGRMAGGLDLAFRPLRRHLAWSPLPLPPDEPYAWWIDEPFYLRPESGGALMCPCDETEVVPPGPGHQPATSPEALEGLADLAGRLAPGLGDAPIARSWCGLRTFAPDRRFVVGWDPLNPRLFWVAGLGGHGMTTGLAVGRLAADLFERPDPAHPLSPSRFAPAGG